MELFRDWHLHAVVSSLLCAACCRCCGCALRSAKEFDKHSQLDPKLAAIKSKGAYKPATSQGSMPG